jgi:glycosyltransferase involved in cell wall biosynthesis
MSAARMRVLLVLGTSGGGVGRHVRDLATFLVQQGHSVVIAGPRSVQDSLDLAGTGARFVPVPIAERPSLTGDPRSIRTLRSLAGGCDVIHAHGLRAGALAAVARGRKSPPPLVVTLHNALVSGGAVAAAYALLERVVARRADMVLGVSADLEARQRALGARLVGHAVVAAPTPRALRHPVEQTRRELGLLDGQPLVVSVARLTGQKGLPLLLDAGTELRDPAIAPLIVIAGDGPAKAVLQQRIHDEELPVWLLGWRDDIPELLAAADVAVSSAVWEGQPIWIQEALAAGCAIVATDVGGTAQVVGDAAVLVPAGDSAALGRAIEALLVDDVARGELRARAVRRSRELPDQAAAGRAALAVYDALLTSSSDDC